MNYWFYMTQADSLCPKPLWNLSAFLTLVIRTKNRTHNINNIVYNEIVKKTTQISCTRKKQLGERILNEVFNNAEVHKLAGMNIWHKNSDHLCEAFTTWLCNADLSICAEVWDKALSAMSDSAQIPFHLTFVPSKSTKYCGEHWISILPQRFHLVV